MATGVEPRDSDFEFTRDDLDRLSDAIKNKEFRKMLSDYCDEMTDPAKQALYQKEMTQLEKERGMDIVFINPEPGYVIKTSVAGAKKAFINICTNVNVGKPSYFVRDSGNGCGVEWRIPYSLASPHDDLDKKRDRCVVYDVVFHPNALKISEKFYRFKKLVNKTACDALEGNFSIVLDKKNVKFPKMKYKGHPIPTVIRTPDPNFKPDEENRENNPNLLDELYPQQCYPPPPTECRSKPKRNIKRDSFLKDDNSPYTLPKYIIKQQRGVDIQEFTYGKTAKQYCTIPNNIIVQINLPLISSTSNCLLDVKDKKLSLLCEKPAKYKLDITLPYSVNDECGSAKFDKSKRLLIVTLPVMKDKFLTVDHQRQDSGVESDNNSFSDEDVNSKPPLITEIESNVVSGVQLLKVEDCIADAAEPLFLDENLVYTLPNYTINSLHDFVLCTFHVKNVEPDSVATRSLLNGHAVHIKFTSTGFGYGPVYYTAYVSFPFRFLIEEVTAEAWDNHVILQLKMSNGELPVLCYIGVDNGSTKIDVIEAMNPVKITGESAESNGKEEINRSSPVVEVSIGKSDKSGVENDNNSCSDEDVNSKPPLITEIESNVESGVQLLKAEDYIADAAEPLFLDENLVYTLPNYTINSLDDFVVYTFHVKNVEPDSVATRSLLNGRAVQLKFTSMGSGYVPAYYTAYVSFPFGYLIEDVIAEAWDNNVILKMKMSNGKLPDICNIGVDSGSTKIDVLDVINSVKIAGESAESNVKGEINRPSPVVEVTIGKSDEVSISVSSDISETNISVKSSRPDESNEARDIPKPILRDCNVGVSSSGSGSYKGILRYPSRMARSLSESSVDYRDFSSSIDCVSSDCIPEESSLKKIVRFNDVIARQVFRSNSSILGQKKKNQRKSRNKKKSLERRLSESEPDEPTQTIFHGDNVKNSLKKDDRRSCKQLLDSGLSEMSDGEIELKKGDGGRGVHHSNKFYDPDKLNKGKYREVAFKNDLIFDLDM